MSELELYLNYRLPYGKSARFWEALEKGELLATAYGDEETTRRYCFPRTSLGPETQFEWTPLSGKGQVYSFCILEEPTETGEIKRNILAYIQSEDAETMFLARLTDVAPENVSIGMEVVWEVTEAHAHSFERLTFVPTDPEIRLTTEEVEEEAETEEEAEVLYEKPDEEEDSEETEGEAETHDEDTVLDEEATPDDDFKDEDLEEEFHQMVEEEFDTDDLEETDADGNEEEETEEDEELYQDFDEDEVEEETEEDDEPEKDPDDPDKDDEPEYFERT